MIIDGKKWHYLAVKNLSRLLRGITSNDNWDFYCLNCFHSYNRDNKLKRHEKVCNNHDPCHTDMPKEHNKVLEYNHGKSSLKNQFAVEFEIKKQHSCPNQLEKSYTEKKDKHQPSGCAWSLTCSFDATKNKPGYYRVKSCIKSFAKSLESLQWKKLTMKKKKWYR